MLSNIKIFLRLCKLSFCRHLSDDKIPWQERRKSIKLATWNLFHIFVHVNFFQNNIQMKCLLTLNLPAVTFFLHSTAYFIHTVALLLTCGMGWTDENWIWNYFMEASFVLTSSRIVNFNPIFITSTHIHPQSEFSIYSICLSCVRHLMRYLLWDICAYMIFCFFWRRRQILSCEWISKEVVKFQCP